MEQTPMTVSQLKGQLIQNKSCAGGYLISFNAFIRVYEFIHRMVIRNHKDVSIVLMDIELPDGEQDTALLEKGCVLFEETVLKSLRREDVAARCATSQYAIILMNADLEQGSHVAERLIRSCQEMDETGKLSLSYQIFDLDTDLEEEEELGTEYGQRFRDKCCIYNNQWISYCVENHHIDVDTYQEDHATLINRMCLHCGYKWTVQHEAHQTAIRKVWSEGRWWNRPME